ncbi:glutamate synthase large subunit [Synechococcus elongatus]|uniref:glutamate synthase large subunit n=1 Tax=Synechococcus elongatus TaxID=32046 RepID=UPI0005851C5A|nr:glutamate synthase large subunit [Synechococcus elongatus]AJD58552.1 glutamate synthase [Synechococcus elongatus UTEX 2973]MBD2588795.1 glutamate synthase large subunit [Synechococcus elongatus FACHB-242]UOW73414.1 glutamate synthase ferredoxin [Synechococcus elongatus PCC 6311]UOW76134.1 glutamate synthase ferredoxin [Synechococcus elongatus PCC 6301]
MNQHSVHSSSHPTYQGPRWLVEERDACGVGFVADQQGRASHDLVEKSLRALGCMEHRGGCSADSDSGDGAGLMTAIPTDLLKTWLGAAAPADLSSVGLGMVFLPQHGAEATIARQLIEQIVAEENLQFLGWRLVPTRPEVLGQQARANLPRIEQCFIASEQLRDDEFERQLYLVRKRVETAVKKALGTASEDFYICSLSSRTVVYKGMVRSEVLGQFYTDLTNPAYTSNFGVYHRRFSTNTMPKWPLAQPMRFLGHNGEINTLLGNINWMMARQADLQHPAWGDRIGDLLPVVDLNRSDSANLDNALELLVNSGRTPQEALMVMVPEAYQNQPALADHPEIVDFYEFYSGLQEPWDGPALLVFSDGKKVGACLDRNGLRPARYSITADGYIVFASEAGVVDLPVETIIEKGRLGPGQMIEVDLETKEVIKNWDIKKRIASQQPYGQWLQERQVLENKDFGNEQQLGDFDLLRLQTGFGYTAEDVDMVIEAMASDGKEPTFCMGDDIPLAVLSSKARLLYDYFKQRFAQVTNPAIDPLRESLVMSLSMTLGARDNLLQVGPESARLLKLDSPVLNEAELEQVKQSTLKAAELSTLYAIEQGPDGLQAAIAALCQQAEQAVQAGHQILILSDRTGAGLAPQISYIPPLLAVGAVHHHLIRQGLRMKASLVVDTAQCWSTHHFACLIGYGASAVCPWLALETVRHWWHAPKTQSLMERGKIAQVSLAGAQQNFRKAVEAGLLKILSKMGISLLPSYHGAQIFEAIGLSMEVVDLAFRGTTSRLGGLTLADIAHEVMSFHTRAFPELNQKKLENFGFVQYRPGGEYHMNSPEMSKALHKAVAAGKNYDHFEVYRKYLEERPVTALRDLLQFVSDRPAISLDEVESVEAIVQRFCTGGMSLGALSREAHETLAIAMNRLGGKSNSGEGGEDPVRYKVLGDVDAEGNSPTLPHLHGLRNGDTASSAIKQIASGRFGVTPEYLMSADQLEIKVSQGAKPGEGGQLPGKKVSPYIAFLRNSKAGVLLISPPPHHDIYSIEDLAQLIFDLHQINPKAQVSVKLVAEIGIGTVAAGVAKANADIIQVSGHDGGTGASPLSSIKHAGGPWELGLTEVHRVLMENQLRQRVLLRVDGGLKTGWDVVMAALMGAEEFGFGSIAMIAEGCIMARVCHTNNCPVGVATQQEQLRKRFTGIPEHVVNFFILIAEEVRSILAKLGYRSLTELTGRTDLLAPRPDLKLTKTAALNLDCLIKLPDTRSDRSWLVHDEVHDNGPVLDDQLLANPALTAAIANQDSVAIEQAIVNTDRSVGARLAGAIAQRYGNYGFEGQISLNFNGSAGQSFGAFNISGVSLNLVGEANDYVGKGMNGGEIIVRPEAGVRFDPSQSSIVGNTCLYGATGGSLFANGRAGERFGVRNSKAQAVVEGTGDHCCEYMTGGTIVVLGPCGRNVGAGMTGGLAYFLDEDGQFPAKVNPEIVKLQRVSTSAGEQQLKQLITAHAEKTGSPKACHILEQWEQYLPQFWQVVPPSEADTPEVNPEVADKQLTAV